MDRSRFRQWVDVGDLRVLLVGVGGLNSYVASGLARLGVTSFVLVDPDRVEATNVATQDFREENVGQFKVLACHEILAAINDSVQVWTWPCCWSGREGRSDAAMLQSGRVPYDVVVVGTDNIESRLAVFAAWQRGDFGDAALIDHRMSMTDYELHLLRHSDDAGDLAYTKEYAACLRGDDPEDYSEERCGAKAIAFTGMHAGGRVGACVAALLRGDARSGMIVETLDNAALSFNDFRKRASAATV
jgi:hypothetical protein